MSDSAEPAANAAPAASSGESANGPVRKGRAFRWTLAVVLLLVLGAGGVWGYRILNRERIAKDALSEASAILEAAEDDLLVVDEAVQAEISAEAATSTAEAADLVAGVRDDALEAATLIADARSALPDDMLELADALEDSARARAEMMDIAPAILEADLKAARAIPLADQAVAEIKGAEDLSAQAVAEFNKHTAASVKTSDDLSIQAEGRLAVAQSLVASATASFDGADFSAFSTYIDAKISLIALAKEIDALWLGGDVAGSNQKLEAYNQRDAEIVAMAQTLPASIRDPIANAYSAATADVSKQYFEARERARTAGERVSELR